MTCFETRLGTLDAESDSVPQKMIDANQNIFSLSLKLRFALVPWYKFIPSPTWRKLLQAEDYFFRYISNLYDLSRKIMVHCTLDKLNLRSNTCSQKSLLISPFLYIAVIQQYGESLNTDADKHAFTALLLIGF